MKMHIFNLRSQYYILMIVLAATVLSSCSVQKTGTDAEFVALSNKMDRNETIRIEVNAAYPTNTFATQQVLNSVLRGSGDSANRIDLSGDSYYLEFNSEHAFASLPFYGERRQSSGYNNTDDNGINFDEPTINYNVELNEKSYRYDIEFTTSKGVESFDVDIILFANGNSVIYITSSSRTRIEYRGKMVDVK